MANDLGINTNTGTPQFRMQYKGQSKRVGIRCDRCGPLFGLRKQNVHMHIERGNINTVWRGHLGANGKEMILHSELLRFKHSKHWRKDNDR